mmetsp:Transcript_64736/g.134162  ORF Transcript_64736/g.134162 Transcript_64736/m.134162 type:complete len:112 (-) Transcript_64736:344-679(-)
MQQTFPEPHQSQYPLRPLQCNRQSCDACFKKKRFAGVTQVCDLVVAKVTPSHSGGSIVAPCRQQAFPIPHQAQSPDTLPQARQQSSPACFSAAGGQEWFFALAVVATDACP